MKISTLLLKSVILVLGLASHSFAQINVSQPASGAAIPACSNYIFYYQPTGSFSTYVNVEIHQDNSSGPIVKTYSNAMGQMYLAQNYNNILNTTGLPAGNYQIKIYDYYNPSNYGWSGIFSVVDLSPPTIFPMGHWGSTFEVGWSSPAGVYEYRIDVSTTDDFQNILPSYNNLLVSGSGSGGFYVTGVTPGVTYYVRVRAVNSCSVSANSQTFEVVPCPPPAAPTATAATSVTPASFVANWTAVAGASQYNIEITRAGSAPQTFTTSNTSYTFSPAHPSSNYSYKVRSVGCGTSAYSAPISVTTLVLNPPAFTNAGGDHEERWINWTSVAGAYLYHFQASKQSNFSTIAQQMEISETHGTFFANICDVFYLRVRSKAETGEYSAFSSTFTFPASGNCRTASQDEEIATDNMLVSFPNPAENSLQIKLSNSRDTRPGDVHVQDLAGHKIPVPVQAHSDGFELNTSAVPPGLYLVTVFSGKKKFHSKFIRK